MVIPVEVIIAVVVLVACSEVMAVYLALLYGLFDRSDQSGDSVSMSLSR